jgi:hypothetical protein
MNQTKSFETQLRSWRPRRPSAGVKARLFGVTPQPRSVHGLHWLAPATAFLLLVLVLFEQSQGVSPVSHATCDVAAALSNHSAAPYVAATYNRGRNRLDNSFEWTNGSNSFSSIGSLSSGRGTN